MTVDATSYLLLVIRLVGALRPVTQEPQVIENPLFFSVDYRVVRSVDIPLTLASYRSLVSYKACAYS